MICKKGIASCNKNTGEGMVLFKSTKWEIFNLVKKEFGQCGQITEYTSDTQDLQTVTESQAQALNIVRQ